ncbi:MAG TPA: PRC-barrel domain-containing protein [Verrucomicrobiae bacterium]
MKKSTLSMSRGLLAISLLISGSNAGLAADADEQSQNESQQQAQQREKSKDEIKLSQQDIEQKVSDVNKTSKLVGMEVRNKQDEKIGKISDVVIDLKDGRVAYAVMSAGGSAFGGGKNVAVPIQAFTVEKGRKDLLLNIDKQQLESAPGFSKNEWPPLNAAETGKTVGLSAQAKKPEASGGTDSQSQQSSGSGSQSAAITDINALTSSSDPSSIEGKQVQLSGATVKEVLGEKLVTVTSQDGQQQVVVKSKESAKEFQPNQKVNVSGKAHKMPQDPSQLGIDQQAAQKLQGQQVYIEANQLTAGGQ